MPREIKKWMVQDVQLLLEKRKEYEKNKKV